MRSASCGPLQTLRRTRPVPPSLRAHRAASAGSCARRWASARWRRRRAASAGASAATADGAAARPGAPSAPRWPSELRQFRWRVIVEWRYLGGRWHVAGWQAHYNAACFYALLPRAERWHGRPRGTRLRRRSSLRHLELALDQAGGALDCAYVRDEDPDLDVAAPPQPPALHQRRSAGMCPDELVIHYQAAGADRTAGSCARGDRRPRPSPSPTPHRHRARARAEPEPALTLLSPVSTVTGRVTFRVRIFDENCSLSFAPCSHRAVTRVGAHPGDAGHRGDLRPTPTTRSTAIVDVDAAPRDSSERHGDHGARRGAGETGESDVVQALSVTRTATT